MNSSLGRLQLAYATAAPRSTHTLDPVVVKEPKRKGRQFNIYDKRKDRACEATELSTVTGNVLLIQNNTNYYIGGNAKITQQVPTEIQVS